MSVIDVLMYVDSETVVKIYDKDGKLVRRGKAIRMLMNRHDISWLFVKTIKAENSEIIITIDD